MRTGLAPDPRAGALVTMGDLRELVVTRPAGGRRVLRWRARTRDGTTPVLAFNATGLVVVGGRHRVEVRPGSWSQGAYTKDRGSQIYKAAHWGLEGKGETRTTSAPDPTVGAWHVLGEVVTVTYETEKKGDGLSLYEHEFGDEGGKRPVLAASAAGLIFVGGDYTVESGGITG